MTGDPPSADGDGLSRRTFLSLAAALAAIPTVDGAGGGRGPEAGGRAALSPGQEVTAAADGGYGTVTTGHLTGDFADAPGGEVTVFYDHSGVFVGTSLALPEEYDDAQASTAGRLSPQRARKVAAALVEAAAECERRQDGRQ